MFRPILVPVCLFLAVAQLQAGNIFLTVDAADHCSGITNEIAGNSLAGHWSANPAPCTFSAPHASESGAASATADYGHLSASSAAVDSLFNVGQNGAVGAGDAYAQAKFYDVITIANGPASAYLRMFYTFSYSGYLNPGTGTTGNSFGARAQIGTTNLNASSSVAGTWNGALSGFVDYTLSNSRTIVTGLVDGSTHCNVETYSSDSCSVSSSVDLIMTGWQVLDSNLAVVADATIQAESGAGYDAPEPTSAALLIAATGLAGVVFMYRCKRG